MFKCFGLFAQEDFKTIKIITRLPNERRKIITWLSQERSTIITWLPEERKEIHCGLLQKMNVVYIYFAIKDYIRRDNLRKEWEERNDIILKCHWAQIDNS